MDKNTIETNRKIQEIFYDFVIDTLTILSRDFELDPSSQYPVNIKHFTDQNLADEENTFLKKSRDTVKYNTYFDLFIRRFTVSEELRVSLLFIDEFVDLKKKEIRKELEHMPYFQIIDDLYFSKKNNVEIKFFDLENEIIKNFKSGKMFLSNIEENKNQLFTLNTDLIKVFIFQKRNKGFYKTLKRQEETKPESIPKTAIITVTQNYFFKNYILKHSYFVRTSLVYIFAITFPLLPLSKSPYFLESILLGLQKTKFFQRYYIFILLKSISKYYAINQETGQFPDFTFDTLVIFYKMIQKYLKSNSIIQNEEIFVFFKKIFSEQDKIEQKNKEINDKHHFVYNRKAKEEYIEINNNDELVTEKHSLLVFRRGNEIMGCNKIRLDYLSQQTYSLYDYYFSEYNFIIEKLEIDEVIDLCINLLFSLKKADDLVIKYHLYNLIPILKRLRNEINIYKQKKIEQEKEKLKNEEKKDKIEDEEEIKDKDIKKENEELKYEDKKEEKEDKEEKIELKEEDKIEENDEKEDLNQNNKNEEKDKENNK